MPKRAANSSVTSGVVEEVGAQAPGRCPVPRPVELRREDQFNLCHDLRRFTTDRGLEVDTAVELGMKEKAGEFTSGGGEVYSSPRP